MTDPRPPLLLTRPAAASVRFAAQFRAMFGADWPVVIAPLTEIVATGAMVPPDAVPVFTSENAIGFAGPGRGREAWCVGRRTAAAARAAGFAVREGPGDAAGLAARIIEARPQAPLVHLRGAEVALPLAETLAKSGIRATEVIVYAQQDLPLSEEGRALLAGAGPVLVPLFSARGAARFAAVVPSSARLRVATISKAVARIPVPAERRKISATPDGEGMLTALARLVAADQAG